LRTQTDSPRPEEGDRIQLRKYLCTGQQNVINFFNCLAFQDGTDRSYRNVGSWLPINAS
jgi:hypothetical protein